MLDRSQFSRMLPTAALTDVTVEIAGLGNVGSHCAWFLAKMGVNSFTLIDFDRVDESNVATQIYEHCEIGDPKVQAMSTLLNHLDPSITVRCFDRRIETTPLDNAPLPRVCIAAFDSIEARRAYFTRRVEEHHFAGLWIDPRMAGESLQVWALRLPFEFESFGYRDTLFDNSIKYLNLPCGARSIAYTGALAGAIVPAIIRRFLIGRTFPYFSHADLGLMSPHFGESMWRDGEQWEAEVFPTLEGDDEVPETTDEESASALGAGASHLSHAAGH